MNDNELNKKLIVRSASWTGISKVVTQLATFTTTLILAHLLSKEDFGLYAMAFIYISLLENVIDLGFLSAIIQRKKISQNELSSCFFILMLSALFLFVISQFTAPIIALWFSEEKLIPMIGVLSLVFFAMPFSIICNGVLSRKFRIDITSRAELACGLLRCCIAIVLSATGHGVNSLIYAFIAERLLLAALLTYSSKWWPNCTFDLKSLKPLLIFGSNITASRLLWFVYSKLDTFIIGRILGAEILGVYTIATQMAMAIFQLMSSAYYRLTFPILAKLQDSPRFQEVLLSSSVYLSIASLPLFLGLSVTAGDIVDIFLGAKWSDVILPLQVLSILAAMQTLSGLLPQALNAVGRADVGVWVNLASVALFGGGFYVAASLHGLNGVLLVWMTFFPLRFIAIILASCSILKFQFKKYITRHIGPFISALVMALTVLSIKNLLISWETIPRLIVCIIAGGVVYMLMIYLCARQPLRDIIRILKIDEFTNRRNTNR